MKKEEKVFAQGMCFKKMFLIFVLGSFLGVAWENILGVVKRLIKYGTLSYRDHRGVIYGPFNPLYGAGIVIIIEILGRKKRKPYMTWLYGSVLGGLLEYSVSFLMELVLGAKSWDYSSYFLNINGRTSIPYMLFWGFAIMILIHYVYPVVSNMIEKIPKKWGNALVSFLVIFMSLDMIVSWTALARQALRNKGHSPVTFVGEFYDRVYDDEFLKKIYVNMSFEKVGD